MYRKQNRTGTPRVGKSKADKADNQRNRILSRAKTTGKVTPDGHFVPDRRPS